MLVDFGLVLLGLVLLYFGAELLVKGAAGLARAFGIAPLVVGLTVVAYGTSMPELVVTVLAALEGQSAIALGNVVGSNIANIGLILGITALISPPRVDPTLFRREVPILLVVTLVVPIVLLNGEISRLEGVLLLLGVVAFTVFTLRTAAKMPGSATAEMAAEVEEEAGHGSKPILALYAVAGLLVLVGGGKALVDGATGLALAWGWSERIIGLTIVAVGTSLPELAASIVAALRGHSGIAIGNVIGSNIFNILLILGAGSLVSPIAGSLEGLRVDLAALAAFTLVAAVMLRGDRKISRAEGTLLAGSYAGFLGLLAVS